MRKLLLLEPHIFNLVLFIPAYLGIFFINNAAFNYSLQEVISIFIGLMATLFNYFYLKESSLIKFNFYNLLILLLFILISSLQILELPVSISFLCVSVINYLLGKEFSNDSQTFIIIGILMCFSNWIFPPSLLISAYFIFFSLFSNTYRISFIKYIVSYLFTSLLFVQLFYLTDNFPFLLKTIQSYPFTVGWYSYSMFLLIPLGSLIVIAVLDHFTHSYQQSVITRNNYNNYLLLLITVIITGILFSTHYQSILLFATFSVTIILGRFVRYISNKFLQELVIDLSILSFLFYYFYDINFV